MMVDIYKADVAAEPEQSSLCRKHNQPRDSKAMQHSHEDHAGSTM